MRTTNRTWVAGTVGAVVLLAAGGFFLGVQPQLARADTADQQTATIDAQTATAQLRVAALSKVAARETELQQQATVLAKAVPDALQANTFYRRVSAVAALDEVRVDSVTQSAGTAYAPPAGAVAAAAPAPSASPSASASASAAVAAPATATAPVLVATDPAITSANLTIVPTVVTVTGTADAGLQFADDIQSDERLFLVSAVSQQTNADDVTKTVTTLTGSVYVLKH